MKIVITGANGTVGSVLTAYLRKTGQEVVTWNRERVSPFDHLIMEAYLAEENPNVFYHLAVASQPSGMENESWIVNYEWPVRLALICKKLGIKFIFTSTVMIFSDNTKGPFTVDAIPDATDGYGFEKRMAEEKILDSNPEAIVARLGWQIGDTPGSNNMLDYLENQMKQHGKIEASRKWYPACSFISDTVITLTELLSQEGGVYLIDSNEKWSFYEICCALNDMHGSKWIVHPNDNFIFDQRLIDNRLEVPSLNLRLKTLE